MTTNEPTFADRLAAMTEQEARETVADGDRTEDGRPAWLRWSKGGIALYWRARHLLDTADHEAAGTDHGSADDAARDAGLAELLAAAT